ncbi:MAG TPA: putative peptidoglycan glycosyltransferase FtsW [Rubrobacter sp.]|jgi:cell division protein FtsW|nr:putative peptidoglycan glycosyltransferase FtsW [Rubrobacter sp.]
MSSLRSNLFLVALGLSMLGLVMVYSATYSEVGTDFLFVRICHMVLGVAAFFVASRVRYTSWRRYAPALYLIVLVGLVLVLVPGIGTQINGARRWLDLGPMSIQPAEFAKLAAILVLSCAVSRLPHGSGLPVKPLVAVGALFILVFVEPDFGTSVVLLSGAAGTLWASELRTRDLVLSGLIGLVAVTGMMVLEPYRRERFLTFLDPWAAADGSGYQVVQSMVAIKAGGFFGSGAGSGGHGPYVPELGTDMIFALIGEELGLIGMVVVISAFGFIALAGLRIAMNAPSVMARCVAAGLTTMLIAQATFNIGAAMVVLPLAGMTLPFVSYGGSSLLVCFAAVGILYRISEDSERATEIKHTADPDRRGRHGRARYPRAVRGG